MNELNDIRNATRTHMQGDTQSIEYKRAVEHLNKVHNTYGTTDPNLIEDLIK
jgi:hypothetical protein